ncbi:WxPxxD family membrane protein [Listeria ivanovii]|uniref:WxPxxD family membrane protein n=1 Tax=Listeria ivanovii (strain ATCC BAA-678 / PAM 55) TaxID=881621 RepID=G2Z885_LISIP|nr:WxPxxD family membrane protein [Listeria ivanovii]AHI54649.1 membrane protein [Listeria ivanovii WSLC3009]AIS64118.1 membrane protein [Listeria ivanovii subsp. ivanovii]MBC1759605.1 WxPxxD family membrane protein [Listeria ivanovii]MBK3914740.1 WxPxxD family membrane protein [Listeria ivanovii subsp. ivanovii]MBK3922100.1 WxPxxD family membrane protein [Listeria ivanovii subsp. ivanovii]
MLKSRYFLLILSMFLFFSVFWFTQNWQFLKFPKSEELVLLMNGSLYGYSSIKSLCLMLVFPYLIFLLLFSKKEQIISLVREKKRLHAYHKIMKDTIIASSLYVGIYSSVNLIFAFIFASHKFLITTHFYSGILVFFLMLFSFYLAIGLLFRIIYDITNSTGQALIFGAFAMCLFYLIDWIILNGIYWTPLHTLNFFDLWLQNGPKLPEIPFILIPGAAIALILYLLSSNIFIEKDFY